MATVTELVAELGIELKKEDAKKIEDFESSIKSIGDAFTNLGKKVLGIEGSLKDFFFGAVNKSQSMLNFAKATGMSTEAFQQWQYAAKATGVSANNVISDIQNLRANYFMNEKSILHMADSFKKMSAEGAAWWGRQYGISDDMIVLLRQGSEYIKELMLDAPVIPEEEIKKAAEFNMKLEATKTKLKTTAEQILIKAAPALEKLLSLFNDWIASDPERLELIVKGILGALVAMGTVGIISNVLKWITIFLKLKNALYGAKVAAEGAKGAITTLNYIKGTNNLLKYTGYILALVAAFETGKYAAEAFFNYLNSKKLADYHKELDETTKQLESLSDYEKEQIRKNGKTLAEVLAEREKPSRLQKRSLTEDQTKKFEETLKTQVSLNLMKDNKEPSVLLKRETGIGNRPSNPFAFDDIATNTSLKDITGGKNITFDGATFNIITSETLKEVMNGFENEGVGIGYTGFSSQND